MRLLQPQIFAHVAVVLFLAPLGAQVEAQLVDDLDAVVLEPALPAVGADGLVDALADLVLHGRGGQLAGAGAEEAAGPLAVEAGAARRAAPREGGRADGHLRRR